MTQLKQILTLQQHPNQRSRTAWNFAQLGLLALPLSQFLGILALLLACGQIWRQQYSKIVRRPLNWGLAVISIWLIVSASFAYNRLDAFLGLFNFVPFFLFFAGFSALIQTPAQLRQLAWILVLTSVPVTAIGLGQLFLGWTAHVKFLWIVVDWVVEPTGNPPGRMASVFMYANVLAGYSAIVFILGLGLWFETYQRRSVSMQEGMKSPNDLTCKYPISPPKFYWGFLNIALIGNLVALILTNSRNAWAIAIFASLAFALYQGWRWLVAGVAGVAGSVLGAAFGPSPVRQWLQAVVPAFFWARLTDQLYPDRPVVLLRKTQWQFAWALTQQRPWTGWGLRNFTPLYQAQMQVWLGHPHNFLLMLTAETGIPGAVLLCGWVSWIVYQGVLVLGNWSDREAVAANPLLNRDRLIFFSYLTAFCSCIIFNTVDVTIFDLRLNILGWLLLSAICGVIYQRRGLNR